MSSTRRENAQSYYWYSSNTKQEVDLLLPKDNSIELYGLIIVELNRGDRNTRSVQKFQNADEND